MRSASALSRVWLAPVLLACGASPSVPATSTPATAAAATSASIPASSPAPPRSPSLSILLRPIREPSPLVHVALELDSAAADLVTWRLASGSPDQLAHVSARDTAGPLAIQSRPLDAGALDLVLDRAPRGPVHIEYDVLATASAPDDPLGVLVHGDHFRGSGEALIALPESIEDTVTQVTLEIERASLEAEKAASSLGAGASRATRLRPRALRYAAFFCGAQGDAVLDTPEGHDEASWIGFPSIDLRGSVVELAEERSAFANLLGAHDVLPDVPWTYLFEVSGSRPAGAFTVTPRYDGVLVQMGSSQPWGAPLRLALGQLLARRWIGDAIRLTPSGHPPELGWFDDGVARYLATRVLARLEVLSPKEWAEVIAQELSVLATSPYAAEGNAAVAARAERDPGARAVLMARGALFAARESAIIRERTRGARSFEAVLIALLARARTATSGGFTPLPLSAWFEELAKEDSGAASAFDALVVRGERVTLPPRALGPCFRAGTGEYVAFDPGFDIEATRRAKDRRLAGLRPHGPAAGAGLVTGDVVESIDAGEGDARAPVTVVVSRAGKRVVVSYAPTGASGRGQTWSRVPGVADERCGLPP